MGMKNIFERGIAITGDELVFYEIQTHLLIMILLFLLTYGSLFLSD